MIFRTPYVNPPEKGEGCVCCEDESLTREEFAADADLNRIMARYGDSAPQIAGNPLYGDFSEVGDYQTAQELVLAAEAQFNGLPSNLRDRFQNNPAAFLAFVHNPENADEARKLGLLNPVPVEPPKPAPMEVIVVDGANFKPGA